ncbi:DUF2603 domain-containing protein [Campylobacter sp. MIT 99-7217]|uniref:DUF2603 domain-containing protein n=1 Tax=Campylobacter sp. MIT 99-7217 TaxID=535091 RepID=UPI001159B260|nr:DUF2603 domain-containing protein [Campylobacter sp. MIT 99-7217]TQR29552.1 DUF2603 domain-containing protein [Campylobacter sp. MIT 99-7217]
MKELEKKDSCLEKIDKFRKSLGIKKADQTVLEITKTNNENEKTLSLKSGHWQAPEPWFVVDEEDKIHTMISLQSLKNMLEGLKDLQKENFELKLEKAIYQQIPIDFNDVWVVAMDEIKKQAKQGLVEVNINLEQLISKIKEQHPNLFMDMQSLAKVVQ